MAKAYFRAKKSGKAVKVTESEWENIPIEACTSPEIAKLLENYRAARDKLAASKLVEAEEKAKEAVRAYFSAKKGYEVNISLGRIDKPRIDAENGPEVGLIRIKTGKKATNFKVEDLVIKETF